MSDSPRDITWIEGITPAEDLVERFRKVETERRPEDLLEDGSNAKELILSWLEQAGKMRIQASEFPMGAQRAHFEQLAMKFERRFGIGRQFTALVKQFEETTSSKDAIVTTRYILHGESLLESGGENELTELTLKQLQRAFEFDILPAP